MARVLVVGGGSAGVGAAWRAAKCGAETMLIESGPILGGTSTLGGVHCWEPGIASAHLNQDLYRRMANGRDLAGCGRLLVFSQAGKMGLNGLIRDLPYEQTLRRAGAKYPARVHFEPEAMHAAMRAALDEAGVRLLLNTLAEGVESEGGRLTGVRVIDAATGERGLVRFDEVIDCTGDAVVCRMAGAQTMFGEDSAADFAEDSAPETRSGVVNGVSLIFRAAPDACAPKHEAPDWVQDTGAYEWIRENQPASHVTIYPNGDRCYNPCPLMQGAEYWSLDAAGRMRECAARVFVLWDYLKNECEGHQGWRIRSIAPRVGVRESWRVRAVTMLTEKEVRGGVIDGSAVALGDHCLDTHGHRNTKSAKSELDGPFGIPLGCLVAEGFENLLVAGRCAGFTHIAASSCRLSRTMMALGEAAGAAAAQGGDMRAVSADTVRGILRFDDYLEWTRRVYPTIGMEGE